MLRHQDHSLGRRSGRDTGRPSSEEPGERSSGKSRGKACTGTASYKGPSHAGLCQRIVKDTKKNGHNPKKHQNCNVQPANFFEQKNGPISPCELNGTDKVLYHFPGAARDFDLCRCPLASALPLHRLLEREEFRRIFFSKHNVNLSLVICVPSQMLHELWMSSYELNNLAI